MHAFEDKPSGINSYGPIPVFAYKYWTLPTKLVIGKNASLFYWSMHNKKV